MYKSAISERRLVSRAPTEMHCTRGGRWDMVVVVGGAAEEGEGGGTWVRLFMVAEVRKPVALGPATVES